MMRKSRHSYARGPWRRARRRRARSDGAGRAATAQRGERERSVVAKAPEGGRARARAARIQDQRARAGGCERRLSKTIKQRGVVGVCALLRVRELLGLREGARAFIKGLYSMCHVAFFTMVADCDAKKSSFLWARVLAAGETAQGARRRRRARGDGARGRRRMLCLREGARGRSSARGFA